MQPASNSEEIFNQFFGGRNLFFGGPHPGRSGAREDVKAITCRSMVSNEQIKLFIDSDDQIKRTFEEGKLCYSGDSLNKTFLERMGALANALLNVADHESQKGRLEFHYNAFQAELPADDPSKALITGLASINNREAKLLTEIFNKCLGIKTEMEQWFQTCHLRWTHHHPLFNPKPVYQIKTPIAAQQQSHMAFLFHTRSFSDIAFQIGDATVKAHKNILTQSPFFMKMLTGDWKEHNFQNPIPLNGMSEASFHVFLEYLYTGVIREESYRPADKCIDLLMLADYLQCEPLKEFCKSKLFELIDSSNFLEVTIAQMSLSDRDIENLCRWFFRANARIGEDLDFSSLSLLQLVTAYQIGKTYQADKLMNASLDELKKKLKLDDDFIALCGCIVKMKDPGLKSALVEVLKTNKTVFESLKAGKKTAYKSHWEAFVDIMTDLDI